MAVDNNIKDKVEIVSAYIARKDKEPFDIKPYLFSVSIFENIYTPYLYCQISILDTQDLNRIMPFVGEEWFHFTFKTPDKEPKEYKFLLYKQDSVAPNALNNAQAYVLRGMTPERAFDATKTVVGSFTGTVGGISDQLINDRFMSWDPMLEVAIEPTLGVTKFVFPSCSPIEAMEMMRRKAVSAVNAPSPYLFFRNSRGYNFISMNALYAESANDDVATPIHTFSITSSNPLAEGMHVDGATGDIFVRDLLSFSLSKKYDTIDKIDEGVYSNYSSSFDLTTKQYVSRGGFELSSSNSKHMLGGKDKFNSDFFINTMNKTQAKTFFNVTDFALELEGATKDWIPEKIGEMHAYKNMMQQQADIKLIGDSDIAAGDAVTVMIPRATSNTPSETRNREPDELLSGVYLLAAVRHDIIIDSTSRYTISASGMKGRYNAEIETINDE